MGKSESDISVSTNGIFLVPPRPRKTISLESVIVVDIDVMTGYCRHGLDMATAAENAENEPEGGWRPCRSI